MNEIEKAYFAGFFDGEGSMGIAKHKSRSSKRGFCHELIIQVSSSNEDILKLFKLHFGGTICQFRAPKNLPMWRWSISSKKALNFLLLITSYLRVKEPQARLAIEFQRAKKYRNHLGDDQFEKEHSIRIGISELNRKGLCSKYMKNNLCPPFEKSELIQEFPKEAN